MLPGDSSLGFTPVQDDAGSISEPETDITALRAQIQKERYNRSREHIEVVYRDLVPQGARGLTKDQFFVGCQQIRSDLTDRQEIDDLFHMMDIDNDNALNVDEFARAMTAQSSVEQYFLQAVPIAELFWAALPRHQKGNLIEGMKNLSASEISAICRALVYELEDAVGKSVNSLRKTFPATSAGSANAPSKYTVCELNAGTISDYHKGLSGRLGTAELNFEKGMKAEHCARGGCDHSFTTSNYKITTTASREWGIVVDGASLEDSELAHGRRIPDLKELAELPISQRAGLALCEVIALVMYTGPMFMVYNAILRHYPEQLFDVFNVSSNLFSTTIHVLQSAVVKLARKSKIPESLLLYRGLSLKFPPSFYKADENGCRGYAEWGFMSTTANRDIAVMYSGAREGKPTATVLQIQTSSVNRPACIEIFSQYPEEREYLWVPLSFMQPEGTPVVEDTVCGLLTKVTVVINSNGSAETIEDMQCRKKNLHLRSFESLADDLLARLREEMLFENENEHAVVESVMSEVRKTIGEHSSKDPSEYVNEETFNHLIDEMMMIWRFGVCKLQLFLMGQTNLQTLLTWPIRTCKRLYVVNKSILITREYDEELKQTTALQVCRLKGLIWSSVDEVNEIGETRLIEAAADGATVQSLQQLLDAKASLEAVCPRGYTALGRAAQYGQQDCVRFLLQANASPMASSNSNPLYVAAQNGHEECVEMLLGAGADPRFQQSGGRTAMIMAADMGHAGCVRHLLAAKADVNHVCGSGETALIFAVQCFNYDVAKELLAAGANKDFRFNGKTAMDLALERGEDDSFVSLLRDTNVSPIRGPAGPKLQCCTTH